MFPGRGIMSAAWHRSQGNHLVTRNLVEYGRSQYVAKYVTKPGGYLELTGEQWRCDDEVLETLHYGLANRRMIAWSRSLSAIRKELGFLDGDDQSEDLVDVGDDDDGLEWKVVKILTYRWSRKRKGFGHTVSGSFACLMN